MLFENVNKILMIQKITIEGYKSIKEQTVELFPINILIGGNGIGKSNFISAFTLIHNLYERNLQNYVLTKGGSDSLLYMGKKETDHLSPMKGKCNMDDNVSLKNNGANIAAFLYYLKEKHPKHFTRIEKAVASVSPFFEGFCLMPNRLNEQLIQLEWKQKGTVDTYFNAYQLSDGTLRFICLATLLLQPDLPKTVIIDEPELGLHPVAVNKLAALIKKASREAQIIISTQSVNLVDNFEPEDIIVVDRKDNATVFNRLDSENLAHWLEDYSLGEIWEKNVIGGQPLN